MNKSKMLSLGVKLQLETCMYKKFIKSFELFDKLSLDAIRYLKMNIHENKNTIIMRKDNNVESLYLILQGKVMLYDNQMNIINEFIKNEICGIE